MTNSHIVSSKMPRWLYGCVSIHSYMKTYRDEIRSLKIAWRACHYGDT